MTKTVILIETDPVVMLDLHGIVAELFPTMPVVHGATFAEIEKTLLAASIDTRVIARTALVNGDAGLFDALHMAVTRGAAILLLGGPGVDGLPAKVIELPFTSDIIRAALLPETGAGAPDARL